MINTTNQTILSLLAAMRAKGGMGSAALSTITIEDAQKLSDFVNTTSKSPQSGIAALTIAMQNCGGLTHIADIIAAATEFDTFLYDATSGTGA